MALREIIKIDEEKCDGCELCIPACAEGALQMIDGKAKLVSEVYCDGMGACLGECPQDAITIEKRNADEFDEEAVKVHLEKPVERPEPVPLKMAADGTPIAPSYPPCPGSLSQNLKGEKFLVPETALDAAPQIQGLTNWPVQLMLAPTKAPYFENAELVIAAHCVPFAFADFDRSILKGGTLLIACPKLDNVEIYQQKLKEIFSDNEIKTITVAFMEVPCCFGLVHLIKQAIEESGKDIPFSAVQLGIRGEILKRVTA